MVSISLFDITSVVVPESKISLCIPAEPKIFLCIFTSAGNAAPVNPNGIKIISANGLIIFFY